MVGRDSFVFTFCFYSIVFFKGCQCFCLLRFVVELDEHERKQIFEFRFRLSRRNTWLHVGVGYDTEMGEKSFACKLLAYVWRYVQFDYVRQR